MNLNGSVLERISLVVKQMFIHGKNLGLFVLFYKSICCLGRNVGINNGVESWIAGLFGGYWAFGDNKGISGSVNNQIVLYLFARGIQGALITGVKQGIIPSALDIGSPRGFRFLAAFSLALILYLTEYHPKNLNPSFMRTMEYLYYESDEGSLLPPSNYRFLPFIVMGTVSLLYLWKPQFGLEQMLNSIMKW